MNLTTSLWGPKQVHFAQVRHHWQAVSSWSLLSLCWSWYREPHLMWLLYPSASQTGPMDHEIIIDKVITRGSNWQSKLLLLSDHFSPIATWAKPNQAKSDWHPLLLYTHSLCLSMPWSRSVGQWSRESLVCTESASDHQTDSLRAAAHPPCKVTGGVWH